MSKNDAQNIYLCHTYYHLYMALVLSYTDYLEGTESVVVVSFNKNIYDSAFFERLKEVSWAEILDLTDQETVKRLDNTAAWKKIWLNIFLTKLYPRLNPAVEKLPVLHNAKLFLFNDFHYLARYIMKKSRAEVDIIEDGNMNYTPIKDGISTFLKKLVGVYPSYGRHPHIKKIMVQEPEKLPDDVKAKGVCLNFHEKLNNMPDSVKQELVELFLGGQAFEFGESSVLVLTQPYYDFGRVSYERHKQVYSEIVNTLTSKGFNVIIKPHPSDSVDYAKLFPSVEILSAGFPIEILNQTCQQKIKFAVGVNTTAVNNIRFSEENINLLPYYKNIKDGYENT